MCSGSALWLLHGWSQVKCCRFGASSVYTIQPCTRLQCHFIQSHIGRVYVCLGVTCHLHFWQNDRDLLRATAVTRGWNGYRNKSQHRKLILEKKILPPLLPGLEHGTIQSRVRRSNHWAIPASTWQQLRSPTRDCCLINRDKNRVTNMSSSTFYRCLAYRHPPPPLPLVFPSASVGLDGISYNILNHLPGQWYYIL